MSPPQIVRTRIHHARTVPVRLSPVVFGAVIVIVARSCVAPTLGCFVESFAAAFDAALPMVMV